MTSVALISERPRRLSSVHYKQLSLGAHFTQNSEGWMRAEYFTNPNDEKQKVTTAVGLSDISHLGKLSIKGDKITEGLKKYLVSTAQIGPHAAFRSTDSQVLRDAMTCVLTHDEALLLSKPSDSLTIVAYLEQNEGTRFHVTDLTSYFTGLYLIGPKSRDVLSKLTEVNINPEVFPDLTVSQLPVFHVRSIILRRDMRDVLGFQIYFDRGFGEYVWDKIMRAGREFDIAPIGTSALKQLGWEWD